MVQTTIIAQTDIETTEKRTEGDLVLEYHLYQSETRTYRIEVTATDNRGTRQETAEGFPADGTLAQAFFETVVRNTVTPYTLLAVYDDFLVNVAEKPRDM